MDDTVKFTETDLDQKNGNLQGAKGALGTGEQLSGEHPGRWLGVTPQDTALRPVGAPG